MHPDYGQPCVGMIVASSYPLFAPEPGLVDRTPVNQQFSTTMAQGVYNAMVTLLNYDEAGRVRDGRTSPGLLDYRLPGATTREPPSGSALSGRTPSGRSRGFRRTRRAIFSPLMTARVRTTPIPHGRTSPHG